MKVKPGAQGKEGLREGCRLKSRFKFVSLQTQQKITGWGATGWVDWLTVLEAGTIQAKGLCLVRAV